MSNSNKYFAYLFIFLSVFIPFFAFSASVELISRESTAKRGEEIRVDVYLNATQADSVSAIKLRVNYDKGLELINFKIANLPQIIAELGTKIDNSAGTFEDNIAFNPFLNSKVKLGTLVFLAKTEGKFKINVSNESIILNPQSKNIFSQGNSIFINVLTPSNTVQSSKLTNTIPNETNIKTQKNVADSKESQNKKSASGTNKEPKNLKHSQLNTDEKSNKAQASNYVKESQIVKKESNLAFSQQASYLSEKQRTASLFYVLLGMLMGVAFAIIIYRIINKK